MIKPKEKTTIPIEYSAYENETIQSIVSYLNMETSGALMLSGEWGCGKTYFIKNKLFPYLVKETTINPIIVSLFGIENKKELPQRILSAFFDKKSGSITKAVNKIVKGLEAISFVQDFVDTKELLYNSDIFIKLLPQDLLICFDDFERKSVNITSDDLFGFINELVENNNFKIIVIANEEKIETINYKEKVIEKTLGFEPSISEVFNDFVKSKNNILFTKYINESEIVNKFLNINSEYKSDTEFPCLVREFRNLRTLKFILNHFNEVFNEVVSGLEELDEMTKTKLDNIWCFVFAVSTEFKLNELTIFDKKDLDIPASFAEDIDFEFAFESMADNSKKNSDEIKYKRKFNTTYYRVICQQKFIFYNSLYEFIVAGKYINYDKFKIELDEKFHIEDNQIKPCYKLLNHFISIGFWRLTNEQFPIKLNQLLSAAVNGEFDDYNSYLNVGIYATKYCSLINLNVNEVIDRIKTGLNIFIARDLPTALNSQSHSLLESSINAPEMEPLVEYIKHILDEKAAKEERKYIEKLQMLFNENIENFCLELNPANHGNITIYYDNPILHKLDPDSIKNKIQSLEPTDICYLCNFIRKRFKRGSMNLIEEEPFLVWLKHEVTGLNLDECILSNSLIKEELFPVLEEAINSLQKK